MRRAQDLFRAACGRGTARYSGFLSDREQALCQAALNAAGCAEYSFEGGYPAAERKLLCIEPAGAVSAPPICCVKLECAVPAGAGAPAHKDYMGSLLGLGLERSCLGDILQDPEHAGTAYAFLLERAAGLACAELAFVGRVAVKVQQCEGPAAAPEPERQMCSATVPSLRADAVLAAMLHCSRGQAGQLVRAGSRSATCRSQAPTPRSMRAIFLPCAAKAAFSLRPWAEKPARTGCLSSIFSIEISIYRRMSV